MVMSILSAVCAGGQMIYDSVASKDYTDGIEYCSVISSYNFDLGDSCKNVSLE